MGTRTKTKIALLLVSAVGLTGCDRSGHEQRDPKPESDPPAPGKARDLPQASLEVIDGARKTSVSLAEMALADPPRVITSQDPYYEEEKRFRTVSLAAVVPRLFPLPLEDLKKSNFLLVASDGYEVRLKGELLLHPAAHLAFADADHEQFLPIGDQKANPGPFYVVWEGKEFSDEKAYPRPWALAKIERLGASDEWRHLKPPDGFAENAAAEKGAKIFEDLCVRCHAINQEGGHVGPDLNVPQNILAYRPEAQVREYIKSPRTFRYSTMPDHTTLTEEDLDALIAYLRLMGEHKFDPLAKNKGGGLPDAAP